jgi:hypothetical protein
MAKPHGSRISQLHYPPPAHLSSHHYAWGSLMDDNTLGFDVGLNLQPCGRRRE